MNKKLYRQMDRHTHIYIHAHTHSYIHTLIHTCITRIDMIDRQTERGRQGEGKRERKGKIACYYLEKLLVYTLHRDQLVYMIWDIKYVILLNIYIHIQLLCIIPVFNYRYFYVNVPQGS